MLTNNPKIVTTNLAACWDPKQSSTVPSVSVIADKIAALSSKAYTTYTSGGITYYVWTYTSTGSFNTGDYTLDLDVLLVAGGGGGGAYASGAGGGAGGVRALSRQTVPAGIHTITVGAGGAGGVWTTPLAQKGNDTIWNSTSNYAFSAPAFLANGGGEGGRGWTASAGGAGGAGGGGGAAGSCGSYPGCGGAGGSGNEGSYNPVEGYAGGAGLCPQYNDGAGGGGGGAAAVGTNSSTSGATGIAGSGGAGLANDWRTGSTQYYGGGGGGGSYQGADGTGGVGGGGNGGDQYNKTPGTPNTGGGGGGSDDYIGTGTPPANSGAAGGSGIVVIRLADVAGSINRSFLSDQAMGGGTAQMYTGAALDFDETDDYIQSASGVTWGVADKWTISWWMYMDSSALQTWFSLKQASPDYNKIEIITNNGVREIFANMVDNDGTVMQVDTADAVWSTGEWTHVAITNNGNTTTLDAMDFYVNGALMSKNLLNGATQTPMTNTARTLNIGQEVGGGRNVDGKMTDIRMYSTALSENNVKEIYENSKVIIPTKNDALGGPVSQTDLKLWLPLVEGAGVVAHDGSGNGNHCTIVNDPDWVTGQTGCPQLVTGYNRPILFDADGYVDTSLTLNAVTDYTFSWWSRSTSQNNPNLFTSGGSSTGGFNLNWAGSTDRPILYLAGSNYAYFSDNAAQDDGQWHHWLLTYNGTATSGREAIDSKLYIDGVNQGITSAAYTAAPTTWGAFRIGRATSAGTFSGNLNEFIIYNGQLGSSERAQLYARDVNGGPLPPDPMNLSNSSDVLAYWRNDGNPSLASTATWADRSGNGYTGEVGGAPYDLLFKQGYNGSESTNSGRDNQGFPLKQKDVGAIGMHLHGVPAAGSATDPGNTANPVMAPPGQTVISSGEVNAGNAFTVSAWINITSLGTGYVRPIARKQTQNGNWPAYGLSVSSTGQLRGEYSSTNYGQCLETYNTAAGVIEQDKWYYVVFLKPTGSPSVNYLDVKFYVNGVDTAWTNSLYGNHLYSNTVATSTQPTYMGRFIDGSDTTGNWVNVFVGQMGPVHLYSRGLTPEEVTQNFNAQRSRFGI